MSFKIESLTVKYGNTPVLKEINIHSIPSGSMVAILGANAVGKSTLLKSIAGLLPYTGEVVLNDQTLNHIPQQQRTQRLGYLPQTLLQSSSLVAYEIIYSGCRATVDWPTSTIEKGIETIFDMLNIQHLALRKMSELSGGQRQMIGLAQLLIRQPKLFLLDEPTSALDLHWQLSVLKTLRDQITASQAIALFVSHDLNLALRFCDQLIILAEGKVLAMGPPSIALNSDHIRKAYNVDARVEYCSKGYPMVIADKPI